jgi:hypothetical protein
MYIKKSKEKELYEYVFIYLRLKLQLVKLAKINFFTSKNKAIRRKIEYKRNK